MKIQIHERNIEVSEALRTHVQRRLAFTLGRFGERIGRVIVRFSNLKGERKDLGTRCQVEVGLRLRGVQFKNTDADQLAAINWVADRAARSIARVIEREHEGDNGAATGEARGERRPKAKRTESRRGPARQ